MRTQLTAFWSTVIFSCIGVTVAHGACPPPEAILERLDKLDLTAAARTQEFQLEPQISLYEKAAAKPGKVAVQKEGKLGHAVLVVDLPIEALWMAANDEDHYAEDGYIPVLHSEVVGGTSRGQDRILFQYIKRAGIGRWWIDQVVMSEELFAESNGMLWELRWWDLMETHTEQSLPEELSQRLAELGLSPIRESRGAWLMIPIEDDCSLIEYVTYSDPGGFLSLAQSLGASGVIRDTLEGVQRLAREHIPEPHLDSRFVRPDGTSLKAPND
ncbi:MAG: hypothetical protein WBP34_06765 [Thermoanaerobaculia bacterium]